MCSKDILLSKLLTWILRHGAAREGLLLSSDGYIDVTKLLQHKSFKGKYNKYDIERVTKSNDKQRFKLRVNSRTNELEIKANQGHSIPVDVTELKQVQQCMYKTIVHGTYLKHWPQIRVHGLSRMQRQHIHLAQGTLQDSVVSGLRRDVQLYIHIDLQRALDDGLVFYESDNGVILTAGNSNGFLEPKYFEKVIKVSTGEQIYP